VVGPDDKHGNKSGKELYELDFGDAAPSSCKGCHGHAPNDDKDPSYFGVYVMAGSTRTESNWLELSQAEQERKVAFGVHYTDGQGREIQNMAPYIQTLSRKEIERVVAHLRTLKPVIRTIKVADPQK
jgi:cytochrome c553